jgi:hypothetical protein
MARARRTGSGVRTGAWHLPASRAAEATEQIVAWCREVMAGVRKPFGIDRFDLAVACGNGRGDVESLNFAWLSTTDLYRDEFAAGLRGLGVRQTGEHLQFAVALFAWGEAAHRALPERLPA